jgi:hypothetical protein
MRWPLPVAGAGADSGADHACHARADCARPNQHARHARARAGRDVRADRTHARADRRVRFCFRFLFPMLRCTAWLLSHARIAWECVPRLLPRGAEEL